MKANNTHIDISKIEAYLNGSLPIEEMRAMEQDPFTKMALDGYASMGDGVKPYQSVNKKLKASIHGNRFSLFWKIGVLLTIVPLVTFLIVHNTKQEIVMNSKSENCDTINQEKLRVLEEEIQPIVAEFIETEEELAQTSLPITDQIFDNFTLSNNEKTEVSFPSTEKLNVIDSVKKISKIRSRFVPLDSIPGSSDDKYFTSKPFDSEKYFTSTKKYMMETYMNTVNSEKRKTKMGKRRFKKFNDYMKQDNLKKALSLLNSSVTNTSGKNGYLNKWIEALDLLKVKKYFLAKQKIDAIPILPPSIEELKKELNKELLKLI